MESRPETGAVSDETRGLSRTSETEDTKLGKW